MNHKEIRGKDKYVFKSYSAIYAQAFKIEKPKLYAGLGSENVAIEHMGSTAVPGLGGKNILDIIVGLRKGKRQQAKMKIRELGYDFISTAGSRNRLFFVKDENYRGKNIRVHLHLVKFQGREWRKILFSGTILLGTGMRFSNTQG